MGKRKKLALKKGAIPSIFNVSLNISGNSTCDITVPLECSTPNESFRKELFGEPLKCSTPSGSFRKELLSEPTFKRACTSLPSKVFLLLFMIS